jgi:hypothetical protein
MGGSPATLTQSRLVKLMKRGRGSLRDAARGELKDIYAPLDDTGKERKPSLQPYPAIPWEALNLDQFNFFPRILRPLLSRVGRIGARCTLFPSSQGEAALMV